jgi:2-methylisocitrate lyase-like PEP mutase family enzyme
MGQRTQIERGEAFRALHQRDGAFIIPNPWDVGSARILSHLGFEALATTSGGYAFSVGQPDYAVGREDLENGFGDAPEATAETIRLAAAAGAVGGSIEDATGRAEDPIYELALAAERVRAAAEVAHAQSFVFTLTARAENYLHGRSDLKNTIKRLQAYQEAGADVLYAPGITSKEEIATLVRSVDRPVNILMGLAGVGLNLADLSAMGVKRVSVGSALARAALGALVRGAREMREHGTFAFAEEAPVGRDIVAMFQ